MAASFRQNLRLSLHGRGLQGRSPECLESLAHTQGAQRRGHIANATEAGPNADARCEVARQFEATEGTISLPTFRVAAVEPE